MFTPLEGNLEEPTDFKSLKEKEIQLDNESTAYESILEDNENLISILSEENEPSTSEAQILIIKQQKIQIIKEDKESIVLEKSTIENQEESISIKDNLAETTDFETIIERTDFLESESLEELKIDEDE